MPLKRCVNSAIVPIALILLQSVAYAMDPRFELDPQQLDNKTAQKKGVSQKLQKTSVESGRKQVHSKRDQSGTSQRFRMTAGAPADQAELSGVRSIWSRLTGSSSMTGTGLEVKGDNYNLSLDPERYPLLQAQDGASVLLDPGGKLPPLMRSLVLEKSGDIRVVSEDTKDKKRFFTSLLDAGRFFSVERDFSIDFGSDPRIKVKSDFKIEKHSDSLMKNDITLLNVKENATPLPASLSAFLNLQGMAVVEPYAAKDGKATSRPGKLYRISSSKPPEIIDSLMSALDIHYSRDSMVELYGPKDNGMRLDVRADRYFEVGKERYIVSFFNGDPVFYTLMRLLETRGYRAIIIEGKDSFNKVSDKFFSKMGITAGYSMQRLWQSDNVPYNVEISGYRLQGAGGRCQTVITNRAVDPLISELVQLNGYTVYGTQE